MLFLSKKGCVNVANTEKMLKEYIREQYKSIREFTVKFDIPYTTLDSIFRRGINNSSVASIDKICSALKIDIGELITNGRITMSDEMESSYKKESLKILQNVDESLKVTESVLAYGFTLSNGDKLNKKDAEEIVNIFNNVFQDLNHKNF